MLLSSTKFWKKWKKELKSLKNQNKIIYSIADKFGLRRELKNIKNIKYKASKKRSNSSSNYYRNDLDYVSSLSGDSDWDEETQPTERKEIIRLNYVVTDNIKTK